MAAAIPSGFQGLHAPRSRATLRTMPTGEAEHDPTEIDILRAENAVLKKQIEEITKTSNQYLQNVAHQLTAPLNAIKWSIEALRKPEVPIARKGKLLSSIYSQGTILVHLIKNFALMSNLEADLELGQFRDKPEQLDLLRLAINLANDFQPQAAEKGQHIDINADSFSRALNGRTVMAVKNLIAQAVSNLLENAVKYADLRTTIAVTAVPFHLKGGRSAWEFASVAREFPCGRRKSGDSMSEVSVEQQHGLEFQLGPASVFI